MTAPPHFRRGMPSLRQLLTVALPTVLAACSEPAANRGTTSAAVEWSLAPEPVMTIGYGDGPEHALGSVVGGLLLNDEQVAVAEGMSGEIRVFSSPGVYRFRMGRKGAGPGQFRGLQAIAHGPNDGVCGWDVQLARVTCFANNGDLLGTTTLDLEEVQQLRPTFVGVFEDGSIVVRDQPSVSGMRLEPEGERRVAEFSLLWKRRYTCSLARDGSRGGARILQPGGCMGDSACSLRSKFSP